MKRDRIQLLLFTLTYLVRYLTLHQAGRLLQVSDGVLEKILKQLQTHGLLAQSPPTLAVEPAACRLVYASQTGDEELSHRSLGMIANALRKKEKNVMQQLVLVCATRAAATFTGGTIARLCRPMQAPHDLHVSEVVVTQHSSWIALAQQWRGEDYLTVHKLRCGKYVPDLALVQAGRICHVIDYAAGYDTKRLQKIDRSCHECGINYELWG